MAKFWNVDDSRAKDWLTEDGKTCPFIGQIGGGLLRMCEYTESYPLICVGRILAYPHVAVLRTVAGVAFDVHPGNQSSRLAGWVRRVHKGHAVTHGNETHVHYICCVYLGGLLSDLDYSETRVTGCIQAGETFSDTPSQYTSFPGRMKSEILFSGTPSGVWNQTPEKAPLPHLGFRDLQLNFCQLLLLWYVAHMMQMNFAGINICNKSAPVNLKYSVNLHKCVCKSEVACKFYRLFQIYRHWQL